MCIGEVQGVRRKIAKRGEYEVVVADGEALSPELSSLYLLPYRRSPFIFVLPSSLARSTHNQITTQA